MALQCGYTLATESPFACKVPHKIMVRLTHLDALCCIDWGGGKGGNWNLYGDSSWSALASDLNCLRTLLGSAMCWSFLRCTRHWVSETNHSSFPSDSLQSANVQKKNIARMRPAILQWFQSILFCLASPAGAAAPCRSRGHVWPVTTSTRLKRSASVLPQMLGFNLGSGAFRDWSLGLPN